MEGAPIDDKEGLPDEEVVTGDVVDLAAARAEAEEEGEGVEDPDFSAVEMKDAEREAA